MEKDKKPKLRVVDQDEEPEKRRTGIMAGLIRRVRRQVSEDHKINQLAYGIDQIGKRHGIKTGKVKIALRLTESDEAGNEIAAKMILDKFKKGVKRDDYREKELEKLLALKAELVGLLTLAGVEHGIVNRTIEKYFAESDYLIAAYVNNDFLSLDETKTHLLDAVNEFFRFLIEEGKCREAMALDKTLNDYLDISDNEHTSVWAEGYLESLIEDEKYEKAEELSRFFSEKFKFLRKVHLLTISTGVVMPDYNLYGIEEGGEITGISSDIIEYETFTEREQVIQNIQIIRDQGLSIEVFGTKKSENETEEIDEDNVIDTEGEIPETVAYRYTKENILKDIKDGKLEVERFTQEGEWEKYEIAKKRGSHLKLVQ